MPLAVCATPIGNLDDVTLRVLDELREADVVLARTRGTRGSCSTRHGIEARLLSLPRAQRGRAGRASCCRGSWRASGSRSSRTRGCPGISDPGAPLVRAALDAGVPVTVLPGPSAVETALVASGLVGGAVRVRRLPAAARRRSSRRSGTSSRAWPWPVVAFESPQRLPGDAALAGRGRARARGRRLPRADEAVRGGRARAGGRARRAVRGAAEGRDHARDRAAASAARTRTLRPRRARRWPSSSRPERRGKVAAEVVSRLTGVPRTTSTAHLCDNSVTSIDNGRRPSTVANRRSHN